MRKILFLLAMICSQFAAAQEQTEEKAFNFEPMVRFHGILPKSFGDHYLAKANNSKISVGFNLSMFEYHHFRFMAGADHIFYEPTDITMTADIKRSRYTSFYGNISYEIPLFKDFSIQPYIGLGWADLYFRKSSSTIDANDVSIKKQRGNEFRGGFYLDYRLNKVISVFTGVNYVGSNMNIHTTPELESYFGKAQTMQVNLGLKLGYSMKDKRKDDAAKQQAAVKQAD